MPWLNNRDLKARVLIVCQFTINISIKTKLTKHVESIMDNSLDAGSNPAYSTKIDNTHKTK